MKLSGGWGVYKSEESQEGRRGRRHADGRRVVTMLMRNAGNRRSGGFVRGVTRLRATTLFAGSLSLCVHLCLLLVLALIVLERPLASVRLGTGESPLAVLSEADLRDFIYTDLREDTPTDTELTDPEIFTDADMSSSSLHESLSTLDAGDLGAAGEGQGCRGRVVDGGREVDGGDGSSAARGLEACRDDAVVVDVEAPDRDAEEVGEAADAGIGQALGQDEVARLRQHREGRHEGLLRAVGDDEAAGVCVDAGKRGPARARRALLRAARCELVAEQMLDPHAFAERGHFARQYVLDLGRGRLVQPEVDDIGAGVAGFGQRRGAAHIGAAPDLADEQAARGGLGIGAGDGCDGDLEFARERAMRRHFRAGAQRAVHDVMLDGVGNAVIKRDVVLGEFRDPGICHVWLPFFGLWRMTI